MPTNFLIPVYESTIQLTDGPRFQIFPDPTATSFNDLNENDVVSLISEKAFAVQLTINNGSDAVNISAANIPTVDMYISAVDDSVALPLRLAGRDIAGTVIDVDANNGVIQIICPTDAITRYYATQFEDTNTGSCRIYFNMIDVAGNDIQFHDNVNIEDSQYTNTGENPPAGLSVILVQPSQSQIIEPTNSATIPLGITGHPSQFAPLFEAKESTDIDGVSIIATGELQGTVDPTTGVGVGNRDYNDTRYYISGSGLSSSEITNFASSVSSNTDVVNNTAKISNATHTGDVTGSVALTITSDAVTYSKMQNVVNDNVLLGNNSGTGGIVDELTASEVRTMINVEDGADVTDFANVDAAGATMNTDTDISSNSWFIDEDDMISNLATKAPSQQSVKSYVDNNGYQPNIIIDGQMNHWSGGTSFTTDGYASDIFGFSEGGGAATVTREEFTIGQTDVPDNPKYFTQHDQTSDGTSVEILYQRLADCTQHSDKNVTFSFYGKVSSGTLDVTPAIRQNFGTGGSPSTEVETSAGAAVTLTTTWQKLESTIAVPSVSGKTIGTDADSDYLEFVLKADDAATTFTAQLSSVAGIQGSNSFKGPWLTQEDEILRVWQYYYESGSGIALTSWTRASATTSRAFRYPIPVNMVRIPSVSFDSSNGWSGALTFDSVTKNLLSTDQNATSNGTAGTVTNLKFNARY